MIAIAGNNSGLRMKSCGRSHTMKEITCEDLNENAFDLIGKDWMLFTAKKDGKVNTMTASWGGVGVMWGKKVAFIFIRPQRYTKEFVDASGELSISILPEKYRKELNYFGTVSGRDEDKIKKSGLEITECDGVPYFKEARLAFICKKLYKQDMKEECFIEKENIEHWYKNNDYHTMYVVEIEKVLSE